VAGDTVSAAELVAGLPFAQARERLAATGHRLREKHSGGASSLLLEDEGNDAELVLHYPPSGAPRAWRYPADPALPSLGAPGELLRRRVWEPALEPRLAGATVAARLMYNPARRAAFLLRPAGSRAEAVVLKLLSAAEAAASVLALRAVAASVLADRIPMPRLLSAAPAEGALLLDFLPGAEVTDWTPALLERVAAVLADVHRTRLEGLPAWAAERDVAKLDRLVALLEPADPTTAGELRRALELLAERLAGTRGSATTTIHRDFTRRHILVVPRGSADVAIGVLDWDSVSTGPPEKDLSTLAAGLGAEEAQALVDRYEHVAGRTVDRDFVTALAQLQRLTRACRRVLAGTRPGASATHAARAAAAALQRDAPAP
jgi:aminoglycoside phosphotransferase (APT) family kinase protein